MPKLLNLSDLLSSALRTLQHFFAHLSLHRFRITLLNITESRAVFWPAGREEDVALSLGMEGISQPLHLSCQSIF